MSSITLNGKVFPVSKIIDTPSERLRYFVGDLILTHANPGGSWAVELKDHGNLFTTACAMLRVDLTQRMGDLLEHMEKPNSDYTSREAYEKALADEIPKHGFMGIVAEMFQTIFGVTPYEYAKNATKSFADKVIAASNYTLQHGVYVTRLVPKDGFFVPALGSTNISGFFHVEEFLQWYEGTAGEPWKTGEPVPYVLILTRHTLHANWDARETVISRENYANTRLFPEHAKLVSGNFERVVQTLRPHFPNVVCGTYEKAARDILGIDEEAFWKEAVQQNAAKNAHNTWWRTFSTLFPAKKEGETK